jgi:carbamoylphosphate synthase large subunit
MPSNDILDHYAFNDLPEWSGEGEVVAKFYSNLEAEVAAARLRAEGIHCFLANSIAQSVTPHLPGIIRLHTHPMDAEQAREILEEASIETDGPLPQKGSGTGAILILAVIIGLILAWLLVRSIELG